MSAVKSQVSDPTVHAALDFLVSRIREQAQRDSVPLPELEIQQLTFSEGTATPEEVEAATEFDASGRMAAFEKKIAKLLRRAYHEDKQGGSEPIWRENLSALRDVDVFVLVMVDQARIPRPKPKMGSMGLSWRDFIPTGPNQAYVIVLFLIALTGFVAFFVLPGFRRSAPILVWGNDRTRGIAFVLWILACALLSRSKMEIPKKK